MWSKEEELPLLPTYSIIGSFFHSSHTTWLWYSLPCVQAIHCYEVYQTRHDFVHNFRCSRIVLSSFRVLILNWWSHHSRLALRIIYRRREQWNHAILLLFIVKNEFCSQNTLKWLEIHTSLIEFSRRSSRSFSFSGVWCDRGRFQNSISLETYVTLDKTVYCRMNLSVSRLLSDEILSKLTQCRSHPENSLSRSCRSKCPKNPTRRAIMTSSFSQI